MATPDALVLVPGMLCDARLWAHQQRHLAELLPVQVADVAADASLAGMAERLLAAAPERFALAGLSLGGYVALEVMRRAGERVTHLALINSSARPDEPAQQRRRRALIQQARGGRRFRGVTPRLLPELIDTEARHDSTIPDTVMAMAADTGAAGYIAQQEAVMARPDSRADLARITCPSLAITGRQDRITPPPLSREIAHGIPGGRWVVIEDCGHLSPLERPHAVTALLQDWLTQHS